MFLLLSLPVSPCKDFTFMCAFMANYVISFKFYMPVQNVSIMSWFSTTFINVKSVDSFHSLLIFLRTNLKKNSSYLPSC